MRSDVVSVRDLDFIWRVVLIVSIYLGFESQSLRNRRRRYVTCFVLCRYRHCDGPILHGKCSTKSINNLIFLAG